MVFYADETMSKVYGDNKYTGGKDGHPSNWPGTGGRPPLEIPASHFFFRWQTDGSVSSVGEHHRAMASWMRAFWTNVSVCWIICLC